MNRRARRERAGHDLGGDPIARSGARPRFVPPTVLVVDDNEDNRDLYSMLLARLGYDVIVAVDGLDGVERAREALPSVVLMDLAMPNLDGCEATRRIRQMPTLVAPYVIAITAFTDPVNVQRALAAGCDEVLSKPCPSGLLAQRVEHGLRSLARAREIA